MELDREQLCEDHFGMVEVVIDEFLSRERNRQYARYRTDLLSLGYEYLVKASKKFDITRGFKFSTYASNAIRYEMIAYLKTLNKRRDHEFPVELVVGTPDEPRSYDPHDVENVHEGMVHGLAPTDPKDREIYYGLIVGNIHRDEVAKSIGVTVRMVGFMKKRIIKSIRAKLGVTI